MAQAICSGPNFRQKLRHDHAKMLSEVCTLNRIYLSVPHLGHAERAHVEQAFSSNWVSTIGPHLDAFEDEFSRIVDGLPCVALASGTAALHLGLKLLGVGAGDEVLCPSLTFAASANPIVYLGARPVFVDSERASWNLDPQLVEDALHAKAKVGKLPKAVIVVHLYGQSADLDALESVCRRFDVPILEDAAEALGTHYRGVQVGTRAPVSMFSFNGNKIITTSGGGMLVAKSRAWVDKARFWAHQSRENKPWYEHEEIGFNYRLSNVLAGIGRGQLLVLEDRVAARREVAARYQKAFSDCPGITPMPQASYGRHTNWLSVFTVDQERLGAARDELLDALSRENIEARPVWKPMHEQPVFRECEVYGGSVAEELFRTGICLPSSSSLEPDDQDRVIDVILAASRAGIRGAR